LFTLAVCVLKSVSQQTVYWVCDDTWIYLQSSFRQNKIWKGICTILITVRKTIEWMKTSNYVYCCWHNSLCY